ncbi:MAG: hypothetical protein MHPSP_004407, partial [Paramarteilia canceri]
MIDTTQNRFKCILFSADMVDYTSFCSRTPSSELKAVLNKLYSFIDIMLYDVEGYRIALMGDCYQYFLDINDDIGLKEAISANEIAERLLYTLENSECFLKYGIKMRIGLHIGEINLSKYDNNFGKKYYFHSDDLDIAKKLGQTCMVGSINRSEAIKKLIDYGMMNGFSE